MDPEELRAYVKKLSIIGSFFVLALVFYAMQWRGALVAYVVIVGVLAALAILIQSGKGGGLAASLGGVGADSLLGTHSATPIAKATYVMLGLCIFILVLTARLGPVAAEDDVLIPAEGGGVEWPGADAPGPAGQPIEVPAATDAPAPAAPAADAPAEAPAPGESPAND